MRRAALYASFALLLIASVASRVQTLPAVGPDSLVRAIVKVLAAQQVQARAEPTPDRDLFSVAVRFAVPHCDGLVEVVPVDINLQEAPAFRDLIGENHNKQFAYLDRVWFGESPLSMRVSWLKHKFLSLLGLSRFVTIPTALLIVAPSGCDAVRSINWSPVWEREMLGQP